MLVRAPHRNLLAAGLSRTAGPGSLIFDTDEDFEDIFHRRSEAAQAADQEDVQFVAAIAILAIIKLVDHGDHPFLA